MSKLLLDNEENESCKILKRNRLIDEKDIIVDPLVDELEKSIQDITADLPLGRALHLLLHVHGQVFDKAIASIQNSTAAELAIKISESPIVKAVVSIQNYISKDIITLFGQIYESLKNKFIKRQPNEEAMRIVCYFALHSNASQVHVQQLLADELRKADKKDQLAVVVLLQFFLEHYKESMNNVVFVLFTPLVQLVEMRSDQPTLLSSLACEVALQFSRIALTVTSDTVTKETTTARIMEIKASEPVDRSQEVWDGLITILILLEKWQKSKTKLEMAAYQELHGLIKGNITDWNVILKYITPKSILSEKPLSIKKQKQILSDPEITSITQLLLLTLLQKGQWIGLYGDQRGTVITSTEQDEIKSLVQQKYASSMQLKHLVPQFVTVLPHLFPCSAVKDIELIQSIIDQIEGPSDDMFEKLMSMIINQPEPSMCYLLMHIIQQGPQNEFAFTMLTRLITNKADQTIPILQDNLLPVINQSNQACELLIKCMDFTELPPLVRKLMEMSNVQDEKEKMTCVALIAKALLQKNWASSSVLNYIDLIREFKFYKGFVTISTNTYAKEPRDIPSSTPPVEAILTFQDDQVEAISTLLMMPLQLWSARVSEQDFRSTMRQFVQYCYGIPRDGTWIQAWKQLSFAFSKNHQLVWPVVESCTDILRAQISIPHDVAHDTSTQTKQLKESVLFLRLSPMLILQAIPKEAYQILLLPNSYVNLIAHKLEEIGVSKSMLKISQQQDAQSTISIQLMDELLQRSLEANFMGQDTENLVDFSISLLIKLFCV